MENEVRVDNLGHGAVVTLERVSRPHDAHKEHGRAKKVSDPQSCFFCPGNEHLTPPELDRVISKDGWAMRVFDNKFPAFSRQFERAYGIHEVIVETQDHYSDFSSLSVPGFKQYILLLSRRIKNAYSDRLIEWVLPFKNEGLEAGASLEHSHSQLVGALFVPARTEGKSRQAKGKCRFCEFAKKEGHKLHDGKHWRAVCPHASRFNYEIWILPHRHVRSLCELRAPEADELASMLKRALQSLDEKVGRPPYNIVFNEGPRGMPFHFHIEIIPRLARWAGFEFGAGMTMNSVLPEDAASLLKF
jgi:UDPglucose--hexose-1-phosphate uridylyltransferase